MVTASSGTQLNMLGRRSECGTEFLCRTPSEPPARTMHHNAALTASSDKVIRQPAAPHTRNDHCLQDRTPQSNTPLTPLYAPHPAWHPDACIWRGGSPIWAV